MPAVPFLLAGAAFSGAAAAIGTTIAATITTAAISTAAATAIGVGALSAVATAVQGGSVSDVLKSAVLGGVSSYVGGTIAADIGTSVAQDAFFSAIDAGFAGSAAMAASNLAGSAITGAITSSFNALITERDPIEAFIKGGLSAGVSSAVSSAVNEVIKDVPGLKEIRGTAAGSAVERALKTSIANSILTNKDFDQSFIESLAGSGTSYLLNAAQSTLIDFGKDLIKDSDLVKRSEEQVDGLINREKDLVTTINSYIPEVQGIANSIKGNETTQNYWAEQANSFIPTLKDLESRANSVKALVDEMNGPYGFNHWAVQKNPNRFLTDRAGGTYGNYYFWVEEYVVDGEVDGFWYSYPTNRVVVVNKDTGARLYDVNQLINDVNANAQYINNTFPSVKGQFDNAINNLNVAKAEHSNLTGDYNNAKNTLDEYKTQLGDVREQYNSALEQFNQNYKAYETTLQNFVSAEAQNAQKIENLINDIPQVISSYEADYGRKPTEQELASLITGGNGDIAKGYVSFDANNVSEKEAEAFLGELGYNPTKEEVQQFTGQIKEDAAKSNIESFVATKEGWTNLSERAAARNTFGADVTPEKYRKLSPYIGQATGPDNVANQFKSSFGKSGVDSQFYEFGLDPDEFRRLDTIDEALQAGQSAFISAAIDAYSKGTMSESELRSELRAAGISDSNTNTLVSVAKDSAAKQEKVNTVFRDLLDPGSDLSLEGAAVRLKEAGLTDTQVSSAIQSITNDFSKASELRTRTDQIIDDYTAWNSDLSREKALERLVTAGVGATRANELLGLVDTQVESQRYLKEVGREAVQRYAAGDISREDAELALQKGSFPVQTVKTMIEYANAIKEGRQLTPGEMEVAAANNLNQWFNVGSGYQVRVARAEDGTIGLVEARDAKGNNITNAFIDPYTQKLMLPTQVPQRVATATNVQVPISYPEFQRLINPQATGNVQFDKNTGQYFTVDDNGNRLLTLDPSKLPVATPENYHAYLTTWGILKNKGLPLPDPRGYATTTAQQTLPPLLQTVGNALSIPTEAAGRVIGNLGAALETFGVGAQRMTEFGNTLANQAVGMRDEEKQQADLRVIDRFRNATTNSERGKAIFDSVLQDPGAVLRMGGVEVLEELPNIAALAVTGGGSALVRLVGMGATQLTDALIESYGGAANEKIQEGLNQGKTRQQAVADAAEDARKAGGITFLANALASKIPFGGTATKEILKNAFIEAPEEFLISKALGDDTNTALNKSALALMISPAADAGLRSSGGVVNLVATPQGLQATYADGAKITIGERDGQVTTAYDLPTTNLINNLVTDALASNQSLPTVINEQLDILSNVNISDFMPTIVSAASNYANPEDITNALITASIENGSFDQSLLTSVINSSLDIPGATDQKVIDSAIGAMLAANQTPQVIANSMFTSGLNSGLSYNTALNDVTSSLLAKSTDPAVTLGQIIPIASQVGLTAGQTPADVANAVFNTALQAGKTANLNATDTLSSAINQTYNSLIAGGLTPDQASIILGSAASQSGTSNNLTTADVLTSINTGITQAGGNTQLATANVVSGQLTGLQTQYNQLSANQKQIADNLVAQGITLQEAITRAKSDLSTEIGSVRTDLQTKIDNLSTEQKTQFNSLSEAQKELAITLANQGTDLATAINQAVSQLGTEIGGVKTEIGEVKTDFQNKYDALTQTQKAQFDALTQSQKDLATQLATQGTDLATAINTVKTELKTEIGDVKTGLETQIGDIKTQIGNKIDALAKTSADADQVLKGSIDSVAADLGLTRDQLLTQLGTTEANLKTEFKTQLDTVQTALQQQIQQQTEQIKQQTAQQKEDARLQRIATGSAAALAMPGLMGQATKQPFIESPSLKSEVTGGIEDPLAKFMKIIQGEPQTAPEVPQPPLGGNMSNTFTYGTQPPSYDELFSNQEFAEDPDFVNREELILPYKAGGSPLNIQMMYAKGGDPREDFRDGKHVAGPGDGQSDDIPAWLADGEFVFPADVVSALGNGSTKAGTEKLYDMMHAIRKRARSKGPKDLPPAALKSPLDYLKG